MSNESWYLKYFDTYVSCYILTVTCPTLVLMTCITMQSSATICLSTVDLAFGNKWNVKYTSITCLAGECMYAVNGKIISSTV